MISMLIDGLEIPIGMHYGRQIIFCSDHRGYNAKHELMDFVNNDKRIIENNFNANKNFYISDYGCFTEDRCDYTEFISKAATGVSLGWLNTVGIAICGTGIGMAIAAGKYQRVYPARCVTVEDAKLSRKHNNANLLCLSAETNNLKEIVSEWLSAAFYPEEPYRKRFIDMLRLDHLLP